ncbi:MAG: hypothetical protein LBN22_01085 [Clostridiales Family XIII bacterium]|jgi:hypothetical protein|nr:hypothetical protein [Clostridiales Family XIII bacterium]
MLPLNYAILKYYTTHDEADADDVMNSLQGTYGNFKSFKKASVVESLMTAHANGLLDETSYRLDGDELRVFYKVNDYGMDMINSYIK